MLQNGSKWTMMAKKTGKAKPGASRKTVRYGILLFVPLCQFISSPTKPLYSTHIAERWSMLWYACVTFESSFCRICCGTMSAGLRCISQLAGTPLRCYRRIDWFQHTLPYFCIHYGVMADMCLTVHVYPIVCRLGQSNPCGKDDRIVAWHLHHTAALPMHIADTT